MIKIENKLGLEGILAAGKPLLISYAGPGIGAHKAGLDRPSEFVNSMRALFCDLGLGCILSVSPGAEYPISAFEFSADSIGKCDRDGNPIYAKGHTKFERGPWSAVSFIAMVAAHKNAFRTVLADFLTMLKGGQSTLPTMVFVLTRVGDELREYIILGKVDPAMQEIVTSKEHLAMFDAAYLELFLDALNLANKSKSSGKIKLPIVHFDGDLEQLP